MQTATTTPTSRGTAGSMLRAPAIMLRDPPPMRPAPEIHASIRTVSMSPNVKRSIVRVKKSRQTSFSLGELPLNVPTLTTTVTIGTQQSLTNDAYLIGRLRWHSQRVLSQPAEKSAHKWRPLITDNLQHQSQSRFNVCLSALLNKTASNLLSGFYIIVQ